MVTLVSAVTYASTKPMQGCEESLHPRLLQSNRSYLNEPQRYPSCAFFGRALSMLFCEGSCAAGKGIRFCHFGNERSCCHLERRACPRFSGCCQLVAITGRVP